MTTKQSSPSQPKLRQSCDGCYHAKVKCKSGPNGCARCITQDLNCVYSPSMRNRTNKKGENRSSNTHRKKASKHDIPSSLKSPSSVGYSEHDRDSIGPQDDSNQHEDKSRMNSIFSYNDLEMSLWDSKSNEPTLHHQHRRELHQHHHHAPDMLPTSMADTTTIMDPSLTSLNHFNNLHDFDAFLNHGPIGLHHQDSAISLEDTMMCNMDISHHDSPHFDLPLTFESTFSGSTTSASSVGGKCSCFNEMLQAIEASRLQSPWNSVDTVMNHNRHAMAKVCYLLRCDHEHDSLIGMLVLVLISKVLNLCESVYKAQHAISTGVSSPRSTNTGTTTSVSSTVGTNITTPDFMSSALSMSPSSFSLSNTQNDMHNGSGTGASTPSTRLTFGSHEFDQDDEHQLKTQMILIRLKKLKSLLNRFSDAQWTGGRTMMDVSGTMRGILLEKVEAVMACMQLNIRL